jgi:N6-L-threonylcarbamoyladenine synthase
MTLSGLHPNLLRSRLPSLVLLKSTRQLWFKANQYQSNTSRRCLVTLAIETSCDDTAVAVVEKSRNGTARLLFNERITSDNARYGGIHPLVSLEAHQENLAQLVQKSLSTTSVPDFVSVTRGPGMRTSLQTGLDTAKGLSVAWQIPIVGVHHMQAHALTPRLVSALASTDSRPEFPFLTLLVSGGHTMLLQSDDLVRHRILADSDLAIGVCLDKVARASLPPDVLATAKSTAYGALLETFAFDGAVGDPKDYNYHPPKTRGEEYSRSETPSPFGWRLPSPFLAGKGGGKTKSLEFSFTGITSRAITIAERFGETPIARDEARHLAIETMRVAFEHLAGRIVLALQHEEASGRAPPRTLVLSGGVAANMFLRHVLDAFFRIRGYEMEVIAPPLPLCTDNAAMIGWAGLEMYEAGHVGQLNMRSLRRWSLENLLNPEAEDEYYSTSRDMQNRLELRSGAEVELS